MPRRYKVKGEVVARSIAGETFLIPVRGNLADMQRIFALNPVAAYVWKQLDGEASLALIRDRVVAAFDVESAAADADLNGFVEELLESGLIACVD